MLMLWFCLAAALDLVFGAVAWLTRAWVGEVFDNPAAALNPREFWSQRWNLVFHNLALRHIFKPLGGRRRFWRAGLSVFLFSALLHEYLVVAALGHTRGHMSAFFALHALATLGYTALHRRRGGAPLLPRPLALLAHQAWLWATGFLFCAPLVEIFPPALFTLR